jgi:Xaa-Pro aminopeptidase
VTTWLLLDDAVRSPELRHEIAEPYGDPIVFLDHDGRRIVVGPSLDEVILSRVADEFWSRSDLGYDDLVKDSAFPSGLLWPEMALRALGRLGAARGVVPATFPTLAADHLRAHGVELDVDAQAWDDRRRRKLPWELEGIMRAQRAAEAAMQVAAKMLREARPVDGGRLELAGELLTAELVREAMAGELLSRGAESEEIMVHSGDACLDGHDLGHGPILADASCVIDCFPRDRRSGLFSDLTRTFVPGSASAELRRLHSHCRAALDVAFGAMRPGESGAHAAVVEYFADHGFPTLDRHRGSEPLREGFNHGLGHGIGLQVHEHPSIGRRADPFVEGDVVAIEPGLYFAGVGGVRLEDTVRVTGDGIAHLTEPLPYDLEP